MMEGEEEDVLEDWFIESLKTYKDLHVYQLEHPTEVLEWTSGTSVCVAGNSLCRSEILELRLPLRLLAHENKGLCAERDFKVLHGGSTDGAVRCLTHVPGTRCVVTVGGRSSELQVWELGGADSDVIQKTRSVSGGVSGSGGVSESGGVSGGGGRLAARPWPQPEVLHGAVSGAVWLTDLTSGQTVYRLETDAREPLTSLQFVSPCVFLAGGAAGNLLLADTRTSAAPQVSLPSSRGAGALWWAAATIAAEPSSCRVLRLSSGGEAVLSDLRSAGAAAGGARLDAALLRHCGADDVQVSWAPALDGCVALSGFDGTVQIHDTSRWGAESAEAPPPLFEHRGHSVSAPPAPALVSAHAWHPERPRTLLSAASDGSVHVWDWVEAAGHTAP